jgi:hypothetical protein
MARFDVVLEDGSGAQRNCRLHIEALSPAEALLRARGAMPPLGGDHVYAVYRHRRARRRTLVGYYAGPGGEDGSAGVREPRRPLPSPPSLSAAAEIPAYPGNSGTVTAECS